MTDKIERLPRCCAQHDDWQQLAEHLCRDFPSLASEQVLRNVLDAQVTTARFDLPPTEALDVGELIVRYRLLMATGQIADVARTDPQTHHVVGVGDTQGEHTNSDEDISVTV
jgi:hypothetical protein